MGNPENDLALLVSNVLMTNRDAGAYGMMLFSRLPLAERSVHALIMKDVPSIRAVVELRSGAKVEIFGVHPRPPTEADTEYRDAAVFPSLQWIPAKNRNWVYQWAGRVIAL